MNTLISIFFMNSKIVLNILAETLEYEKTIFILDNPIFDKLQNILFSSYSEHLFFADKIFIQNFIFHKRAYMHICICTFLYINIVIFSSCFTLQGHVNSYFFMNLIQCMNNVLLFSLIFHRRINRDCSFCFIWMELLNCQRIVSCTLMRKKFAIFLIFDLKLFGFHYPLLVLLLCLLLLSLRN